MARILVADDEAAQRLSLQRVLRRAGHEAEAAADALAALELLRSQPFDVVVTDMRMPGMTGRELLQAVRKLDPNLPVIIITAYAELKDAVELVTHEGAFYYLEKPIEDIKVLMAEIERALQSRADGSHPAAVKTDATPGSTPSPLGDIRFEGIVGASAPMRQLFRDMQKLLPILKGPATVLITGESGTGKELIARALHDYGPRKNAPFVAAHCAAIPEELMEAELFGAEKGAYTSLNHSRAGYFEDAQHGTLFLDEISEILPTTQVKLLRVLAAREYARVGSTRPKSADVCVIAATNRDLEKDMESGRFREDLFYRLNVFRLRAPALRDRRDDIPALAKFLLARFFKDFGLPPKRFTDDALQTLRRFPWPGNVRQLDHYIQQAVVMSDTDVIHAQDLPAETNEPSGEPIFLTEVLERGLSLEEVERQLILMALERAAGNQTRAAKLLGVSRRKLQYRMDKRRIASRAFRDGRSHSQSDDSEE